MTEQGKTTVYCADCGEKNPSATHSCKQQRRANRLATKPTKMIFDRNMMGQTVLRVVEG